MSGFARLKALPGWVGAGIVLAYAALLMLHYHHERSPELDPGVLSPTARSLNRSADRQLDAALATLLDAGAGSDRVRNYRQQLGEAEALLVRSLRAQPAQPGALARLAATRWERDPLLSDVEAQQQRQWIDVASQLAPEVFHVQQQLGQLLLKMGRRDEALRYLGRALELDPSNSREVLGQLAQRYPVEQLASGLPRLPEVLEASAMAYVAQERALDYLEVVETWWRDEGTLQHAPLLATYTAVALVHDQAARLRATLDALGAQQDTSMEAERLRQRSRAGRQLGDAEGAIADAKAAVGLQPQRAALIENLGDMLVGFGQPEEGIEAFRESLERMARADGTPQGRAQVYRKIGQAEERRGALDQAYEAYRKSLRLDPNERLAQRRIMEMERAAGL